MNKLKESNYYAIMSLSMVNYLVRCGHDIVNVGDNTRNSKYKCFMFIDTPKLRKDMESFKHLKKDK